jgi:DNA invertase Pin-like site-specific DNA recombinase
LEGGINVIFKQQHYYAAQYARLSDEDENEGESCSIDSQRKIMEQYCESKDIQVAGFYADDGFTGTNFDRPDFQRLVADIKLGKINLVIVKDLSRFGRNYIDSGFYIEQMFDEYNVRFIAIDNNIDTLQGENMVMPIINIMNDYYAKDISKKTVSALNARARSGQYLASKPAYGYMKSPDDNHKLMPDPVAADVVREIFTLASTTHGYHAIVNHLTRKGVLTPQSYLVSQNPDYFKKKEFVPHCQWNNKTVTVILNNPIYLGNLIYGKTRSKRIRSKDRLHRPEDEWIVREGTHEAIISQELWDAAHERLTTRKREGKNGEIHMFAGYIYCMDCGAAMTFNNRDLNKELNGEFMCGSYKRKGKHSCTTHYVTFEKVYQVLLADIQAKSRLANSDNERFMRSLEQESDMLAVQKTSHILQDEQKVRNRIGELDRIIEKLYEDSALGVIPQERFASMFSRYDSEQRDLKVKLAEADRIRQQQADMEEKAKKFAQFIEDVTGVNELTPILLSRLIKRITIGQAMENPVTGQKQQDIEIEFALTG